MNRVTIKNSLRSYGFVLSISALLLIWSEQQDAVRGVMWAILPATAIGLYYSLNSLVAGSGNIRRFFLSLRGMVSALVLLGSLIFTCFPAISLSYSRYYPFHDLLWLATSVVGLFFCLSFLNYSLSLPESVLARLVRVCRIVWSMPVPYLLLSCAIWLFAVSNFFSYAAFEHIPHVQDEIAQLFQAKIFARGSLTAPVPPLADFFRYYYDNIILNDRWYSQYPPGHPFFLMLGVLAKVPWLINPLFASLSVILLYKKAFLYYGEKEAKLSVILFCISPFALFMSASFMNHVSGLFFLLLFLYCLQRTLASRSVFYALACGFSIGMLLNIRPGDAVAVGMVFIPFFFIRAVRNRSFGQVGIFVCATGLMLGIVLLYNYATNGDPLLFGYQVRWGKEHSLGFSNVSVLGEPAHTPRRGVIHTLKNFVALNENLFEWPLPSLILLAVFFMPFLFKKERRDYLLLCGLFAAPVFYFFYFFQDLCLGARLYYISLPFILLLTARAVFLIIDGIAVLRGCPAHHVKNAFIALFLLCVIFSGALRIPKLYAYYSDRFWEVDNRPMQKVRELGITNAVIFLRDYGYKGNDLGSGFLNNSPWLDSSVIFARDLGQRNAELATLFPGRQYYLAIRDKQGEVSIAPMKHTVTGISTQNK